MLTRRLRRALAVAATVTGLGLPAVVVTTVLDGTSPASQASLSVAPATNAAAIDAMGKAPLSFEPNVGQADAPTSFVARGLDYALSLSPTEATLSTDTSALRMRMVGGDPKASMAGRQELEGRINYFVGNDPARWRSDVATYAQVAHEAVWPGIDLVWHSAAAAELEYDFVVAPGADPDTIAVAFDGAKGLRLDGAELVVDTEGGELRQRAPVLYQDKAGTRSTVPGRFVLDGTTVRFSVGAYDTHRPLVIDPVLEYSTYLGGKYAPHRNETGNAIAVDSAGAAYVTGQACTSGFPATTYAFQKTKKGECDAFVTKFKPVQGTGVGTGLAYSTYLGGSGKNDYGTGIVLDSANNAYVAGTTLSGDFPVTAGAYRSTIGGVFLTKLNHKGSKLLYSTHLNGSQAELVLGPALPVTPTQSTVYLSGRGSGSPATPDAFHSSCYLREGNCEDHWVARVNPVGGGSSDLVYASTIGGTGNENNWGHDLAVDNAGRIYVSGTTTSPDFPMAGVNGSFDTSGRPPSCDGCTAGFLAMLDPSLPSDGTGIPSPTNQQLVWSTYVNQARIDAMALGPDNTVYAAGSTSEVGGGTFPTTDNAYNTTFECSGFGCMAFVAKLDPDLPGDGTGVPSSSNQQLLYSTYIGAGKDDAEDIAVDAGGRAWVTGHTFASATPTKNPVQSRCGCFYDVDKTDGFVAGIDPAGNGEADFLFGTFLGGKEYEGLTGIALDAAGSLYVTGRSASYFNSAGGGKADRYPVRPNNFQMDNPGGKTDCAGAGCSDAVVSKISGF